MSDEPSDAQKLIREVVRVHRFTSRRVNNPNRPGFLVNVEACKGCDWYGTERNDPDHDAHVASEVDKALGGLTQEHVSGMRVGDDPRMEPIYESRWVSGWTVTE